VAACAVVGGVDARSGECVNAYVVLAADQAIDGDSLIAFCADRLARYKCPQKVTFVDELPVGVGGKILRRALR
jgi:acyl-CoA synthetase (AMP-forming)/AMP-acid ligase II